MAKKDSMFKDIDPNAKIKFLDMPNKYKAMLMDELKAKALAQSIADGQKSFKDKYLKHLADVQVPTLPGPLEMSKAEAEALHSKHKKHFPFLIDYGSETKKLSATDEEILNSMLSEEAPPKPLHTGFPVHAGGPRHREFAGGAEPFCADHSQVQVFVTKPEQRPHEGRTDGCQGT